MREWGDPGGVPFIFWHSVGTGGTGATIEIATGPLTGAGVHVLAPDAPGFGRSAALDADAYTLDRLAGLFWELADALGAEQPVLAGHSWGGAVAVVAAGLRPDRTKALVLYDSGHCDYADWPGADLSATLEELIVGARADADVETWEALVDEVREHGLDQPWMLDAWREAVREMDGGGIALRHDPAARGAAFYHLMHERPSSAWPAITAAGIPTLLLLATEPEAVREANELLTPRFVEAVPHADVVRPGCRHQVFADLGPQSGVLVADWLGERGLL